MGKKKLNGEILNEYEAAKAKLIKFANCAQIPLVDVRDFIKTQFGLVWDGKFIDKNGQEKTAASVCQLALAGNPTLVCDDGTHAISIDDNNFAMLGKDLSTQWQGFLQFKGRKFNLANYLFKYYILNYKNDDRPTNECVLQCTQNINKVLHDLKFSSQIALQDLKDFFEYKLGLDFTGKHDTYEDFKDVKLMSFPEIALICFQHFNKASLTFLQGGKTYHENFCINHEMFVGQGFVPGYGYYHDEFPQIFHNKDWWDFQKERGIELETEDENK